MRVRICHAYFSTPNLRNLFGEIRHYKVKRELANKYERLLPHICDILKIPIDAQCDIWIRKNFDPDDWDGAYYNPHHQRVQISMDEPSTNSYWQDVIASQLRPIEFDWHVYTLAHELAHFKQYFEKRIQSVSFLDYYFEGEYHSKFRWDSHFDKPWELDANTKAIEVIQGLHTRGLI